MSRLASLRLVKSIAGLPEDSPEFNDILIRMLEADSDMIEYRTRRVFAKQLFVEKKQSYDQDGIDPTPQRLFLNAPLDVSTARPVVTYAGSGDHTDRGGVQILTEVTDYTVDEVEAIITILPKNPATLDQIPVPLIGGLFYAYASDGFQITYTGGFVKNDVGTDDWVKAPRGLQMILAQKVASDYLDCKATKVWSKDQVALLVPYSKKDILI